MMIPADTSKYNVLASPGQQALDQWRDLTQRYCRLLCSRDDPPGYHDMRPDPPPPEWFQHLVAAALDQKSRPLLREILLHLLGEDITAIAAAAAREARRG